MTEIRQLVYSLYNYPHLQSSYNFNRLKLEISTRKYLGDGQAFPTIIARLSKDSYIQEISSCLGKQITTSLIYDIIQKALEKEL